MSDHVWSIMSEDKVKLIEAVSKETTPDHIPQGQEDLQSPHRTL